jgi:uncharacterized protein
MKFLVLILVVLVVLWLARGARRTVSPPPPAEGPARQPAVKEPMLACAQCGLHLPRDEALPGRGGVFCGEAHRAEYEKAHPTS